MARRSIDKDSKLALFSIAFLVVGIIGVYGYYQQNSLQVNADQEVASQVSSTPGDSSVILKVGKNYLTAGPTVISDVSPLIAVNGEVISVREAKNLGIISSVYTPSGGDILSGGVTTIDPGADFVIEVTDVTGSPIALLK
jgi:hypothetical protein